MAYLTILQKLFLYKEIFNGLSLYTFGLLSVRVVHFVSLCKTLLALIFALINIKVNLLKLKVNFTLAGEYVYFNNPIQYVIYIPLTLYLFLSPLQHENIGIFKVHS